MALTAKQKRLLDYIADYIDERGYSPSYDEMKQAMELSSVATIHKHVEALEERRYLRRTFNHSRSIDVTPAYAAARRRERGGHDASTAEVPLAGRIAAGAPVEAIPDHETLAFAEFTGKGDAFALQVRGESMIEDHICDGDFVLVEKVTEVRNGDIVVALVGGMEATLKRFYKERDGSIRLQPANRTMEPILVQPDQLQIQGRVISVMRKYR